MRQQVNSGERFRRGNAPLKVIVAGQNLPFDLKQCDICRTYRHAVSVDLLVPRQSAPSEC